jgi:hypothetical protein
MDNYFWLYATIGLPYAIRTIFFLAIAVAWVIAYSRWLKSAGVILIILGLVLSILATIASGGLAIYLAVASHSNPGLYRTYSAYIGMFYNFAPIPGYILELAGALTIAFRKRTSPQ